MLGFTTGQRSRVGYLTRSGAADSNVRTDLFCNGTYLPTSQHQPSSSRGVPNIRDTYKIAINRARPCGRLCPPLQATKRSLYSVPPTAQDQMCLRAGVVRLCIERIDNREGKCGVGAGYNISVRHYVGGGCFPRVVLRPHTNNWSAAGPPKLSRRRVRYFETTFEKMSSMTKSSWMLFIQREVGLSYLVQRFGGDPPMLDACLRTGAPKPKLQSVNHHEIPDEAI